LSQKKKKVCLGNGKKVGITAMLNTKEKRKVGSFPQRAKIYARAGGVRYKGDSVVRGKISVILGPTGGKKNGWNKGLDHSLRPRSKESPDLKDTGKQGERG